MHSNTKVSKLKFAMGAGFKNHLFIHVIIISDFSKGLAFTNIDFGAINYVSFLSSLPH